MRRTLAALVGLALLLAAACGVPADDKPRAISREQIPGEAGAAGDPTANARTKPTHLYYTQFVGDRNQLVPVVVPVPIGSSTDTGPPPAAVLETLLSGIPGGEENVKRYTTNIPPKTALASPPQIDRAGTLTVDLNDAIFDVGSPASRLAFGQIVCTADALPGVNAVRFEVAGRARPVPMGDGEASSEPLTCKSYENLTAAAKG